MNTREAPELVCSSCGKTIIRSFEYGNMTFVDAERWAAVTLARHKHECNAKMLCSGFGFFPGGDKCPGCTDCNPTLAVQVGLEPTRISPPA